MYKTRLWIASMLVAAVVAGCRLTDMVGSKVDVTNGAELSAADYPEVVSLRIGNSGCTGTFVSHNTVITAAHCVGKKPVQNSATFKRADNATSPRSTKIIVHPRYASTGTLAYDLAFIIFPDNSSAHWSKVATDAPQVNDPLTVVGFGNFIHSLDSQGRPNGTGGGKKRKGDNVVAEVRNGYIIFNGVMRGDGSGIDAASSQGDSGGPMFVRGAQVGVTSNGSVATINGQTRKVSNYVDLNSQWSKVFLQEAISKGALVTFTDTTATANTDIYLALEAAAADNNAIQSLLISLPLTAKDAVVCSGKLSAEDCLGSSHVKTAEAQRSDKRAFRRSAAAMNVTANDGFLTVLSQGVDEQWTSRVVQLKAKN